jgi:hypothetical protein
LEASVFDSTADRTGRAKSGHAAGVDELPEDATF